MITIDELVEQHKVLVAYLKSKIAVADWHGGQDSCSDLREIEAQLAILRDLEKQGLRPASEAEQEAQSPKWASRLG